MPGTKGYTSPFIPKASEEGGMDRRNFITTGLVFFAGFGLAACQHERREEPFGRGVYRYNRPPHEARHGHAHRHANGVDLIYDSGLGAYRVRGHNSYYYRGRFYRVQNGRWESRGDIDRPWRPTSGRELPRSLRREGVREDKQRDRRRQRREDAD
jgi:hypothetical protein